MSLKKKTKTKSGIIKFYVLPSLNIVKFLNFSFNVFQRYFNRYVIPHLVNSPRFLLPILMCQILFISSLLKHNIRMNALGYSPVCPRNF